MKIKRAVIFLSLALALLSAAGYVVALLGATSCEDIVRAEVTSKGVTGLAIGGGVIPASAIEVYSHIDFPFVVTAGYAVPFDLHVTYHDTQFLVLPWHVYPLSSRRLLPV